MAGDRSQTAEHPARHEDLQTRLRSAGPWFHNLRIQGVETAPEHFLGDYPYVKWRYLADALPEDLGGKSVLDIGCNAGYYSIELKRRKAGRVLGIDTEELYLNQARIARDELALDIEYQHCSAYDVPSIPGQFDIVLFMGLFYHLRYPLYALDRVVQKIKPGGTLVFQTLFRPQRRAGRVRLPVLGGEDLHRCGLSADAFFREQLRRRQDQLVDPEPGGGGGDPALGRAADRCAS